MVLESFGGGLCASMAAAWAVRGRSSRVFGPSVWRGDSQRRSIALTFDDGPSESTAALLDILERRQARATFFLVGANVERLPAIARRIAEAGHEIGNHSYSHPRLHFRTPGFIRRELERAQRVIEDATGVRPRLFRAPYGVRWFGLRGAQRHLDLAGVMWTAIARDWRLPSGRIVGRLLAAARPGAIFCLHDGRELERNPSIGATLDAAGRLSDELGARGFHFETVSQIICPRNP